jgi:hypothetical protein
MGSCHKIDRLVAGGSVTLPPSSMSNLGLTFWIFIFCASLGALYYWSISP